jgi:hypothetical protein
MVAILHPFLPIREATQINFILRETKGQVGLSSTILSLSIIMRALEVLKPGSDDEELT